MLDFRDRDITYRDLRDYLAGLSDATLDQPIQVHYNGEAIGADRTPLLPVYLVATVAEGGADTRDSIDNGDRPESLVIWADYNPFAEDGSIGEDLMTGERIWPGGRKAP